MAFLDRFGGKKKSGKVLSAEEIKQLLEEADRLCENEEYDKAFALDSRAAEAGDARAQTHMGWYYENGYGVTQDFDKAFEWYSRAAEQNFAPAQYCLGMCYEEAVGTAANPAEARRYYALAAAQGMEEAKEALARLTDSDDNKTETPRLSDDEIQYAADVALALLEREQFDAAKEKAKGAAEYGNPTAMYVLGFCLLREVPDGSLGAEAEKWLRASADAGFAQAMLCLGIAYSQGKGVHKNLEAAAELFEAAANAGNRHAYYHLGCCYEFGEGVGRNISRAVELYRKGADVGDPLAQFSLGQCYMTGTGVEEDYEEAARLFKAAAEQGCEGAQESLAMLEPLQAPELSAEELMEGKLADAEQFMADRNYDAARPLIEECAEVGMPRAQTIMGHFYCKALAGYPRNSAKALKWYRRGADGGDVEAMFGAAAILETDGKEADIVEAARYYEHAAAAGNKEAAYRLGRVYENGKGVGKDERRAFTWYMVAAEGGDVLSQRIVASMFETGRGTAEDLAQALEWYEKASRGGDLAARKAIERLKAPSDGISASQIESHETEPENITPDQAIHLVTLSNNYYDEGNYDEAAAIDRRLAEAGNFRGINSLGWDYYEGHGVPRDYAQAFDLFLRAAEAGEPRAMVNLGCCYQDGTGVVQDYAEALRWFRRAADAGWYNGYFNLGVLYSRGLGVEANQSEAIGYWKIAAEHGSAAAYACLGNAYENDLNDYVKAFEYYRKGALLGSGISAYNLGVLLEDGKGCDADRERAIYFYRLAVLGGVEDAREALDRLDVYVRLTDEEREAATSLCKDIYDTDRDLALEHAILPAAMNDPWAAEIVALCLTFGSFKDERYAARMFKIAAKAGLSASQDNLGWCYEKGLGVDIDHIESVYWYRKGAENGSMHAMSCYAWCLSNGFGCDINFAEAMDWYRRAAEKGDPRAFYNLGVMYERGQGAPIDYDEARRLYRKAADMNYDGAEQAIKNIEGKVTPVDGSDEALAHAADSLYDEGHYDEAFAKARRPADNGNPMAAQVLGLCYEFGRGTAKDMTQAVKYYSIAAEAGFTTSLLNLGVAYQYGEGGLPIDLKKAVDLYRKAAEKGDRVAQCNLGYCYEQGDGVAKDLTQAAYWYRKSADQNWARAQAYLGECYEKGWGVTENHKTALDLYFKSAANGHSYGQMRLARCYDFGIGIAKNAEEALRWYTKAADGGNEFARTRLAEVKADLSSEFPAEIIEQGRKADEAYGAGRYDEAFRLARIPAEAGEPRGCEVLALCYDFGNGTEPDMAQAVRFYKISAAAGLSASQLNLGVAYENGEGGLSIDLEKAVELYRAAAEQGHRIAQCNLGWCYEKGLGVEIDMAQAAHWYRKSADKGWARAQLNLGVAYEFGNGVIQDVARSVALYRAAAEQGNRIAQCNLGYCYEIGKGVDKDMSEAAEWYRKSADQEWPRAQAYLGELYEKGEGVPCDVEQALKLYRMAAERNYPYAQSCLGRCYENGIGVRRDIGQAIEWYEKAADNGNEYAKKRLQELK